MDFSLRRDRLGIVDPRYPSWRLHRGNRIAAGTEKRPWRQKSTGWPTAPVL